MTYIYQLTAFEYSDFRYWLLTHEKKYTEEEFKAIVKEADSKVEVEWVHFNYINYLIYVLVHEYGFKRVESTIDCYIGGFEGSAFK